MPIIILNGPPRSGKDSIAKILCANYKNVHHAKFANELKRMTHRLYNVENAEDPNKYEEVKDLPHEDFHGISPREAYISVSEFYVKKVHGKTFFGERLVEEISKLGIDLTNDLVVISDGGFKEETYPLIEEFGGENLLVLPLSRTGCSFSNDSRSYLDAELFSKLGVQTLPMFSAGDDEDSFKRLPDELSGHLQTRCTQIYKVLTPH